MAEISEVGIANGVPNSGTGEVPTLVPVRDLLTTIDADTGAMATSLAALDNAISGNEMQVDIVGALPAGDNNIGNVDIVTVPTDPFGANADAASATGSISAKLRGIATALGVTAFDLGIGTGGSRTIRVAIDSAQVAGQAVVASATFNAAAAAYTAGDIIGAAAEFDFGATSGASVMITSATIRIDHATAEATAWRLHLFNVTPPSALADNAPFVLPSGDRASYLGYIDLPTCADFVDTQWSEIHGINKQVKLSGDSVFGYLAPLTGLTPNDADRTVTLHAVPV